MTLVAVLDMGTGLLAVVDVLLSMKFVDGVPRSSPAGTARRCGRGRAHHLPSAGPDVRPRFGELRLQRALDRFTSFASPSNHWVGSSGFTEPPAAQVFPVKYLTPAVLTTRTGTSRSGSLA